MNYLMPKFFIVCLIVGSLQKESAGVADTVCIKTHTGGCRNHKQIHISTVRNVDSVASCLNECASMNTLNELDMILSRRLKRNCKGFSVSKKKKVCILYSGECQKDGNQNWDYYLKESCMGADLEIDDNKCGTNECGINAECNSNPGMDIMECHCLPGHFGDPNTGCWATEGCNLSGTECYLYGPNLRESEFVWNVCEALGGQNCRASPF